MSRSSRRGPWLPEEDNALVELVRTQGPNNWVQISQQLQHRSPKQCRERYHQNLKPTLNHEPISVQEGEVIEELVQEMGKRWAEIARRLGNRSDNAVKNWWNGSMNRRRRSTHVATKQIGNRCQPIPSTKPRPFSDSSARAHRLHDKPASPERWSYQNEASTIPVRPRFDIRIDYDSPPTRHSHVRSSFCSSEDAYPQERCISTTFEKAQLPPLRLPIPRPSISTEWHPLNSAMSERSVGSPAVSDTSNTLSIRQEPSLVSDSQSNYSISPRTISTPKPVAPILPELQPRIAWPTSVFPCGDDAATTHANAIKKDLSSRYAFDSTFRDMRSAFENFQPVEVEKNRVARDTRMHVSSLVQ